MRKPLGLGLAALLLTAGLGGSASAAAPDTIDIPFTTFTLPNGLTVVVSEDHKAPVVAVSVWYHIGSADEPDDPLCNRRRTGRDRDPCVIGGAIDVARRIVGRAIAGAWLELAEEVECGQLRAEQGHQRLDE